MELIFERRKRKCTLLRTRDPTMFLQETYIGSLCYTFQIRFIFDATMLRWHNHLYHSRIHLAATTATATTRSTTSAATA